MSTANVHSGGNFLRCVAVSPTQVVGVTSLDEMRQYGLIRPSAIEDARMRELKGNADLFDTFVLREAVQRRFDKARRKRAVEYAAYIEGVASGRLTGSTPPVTLYSPESGVQRDGGLQLPYTIPLVAIDGETQIEARFLLREKIRESGVWSVPFALHHGISPEEAGGIMHDYNCYATPVPERTVAAMNAQGSITRAVNMALQTAQIPTEQIERHNTKPGKDKVTGFSRLMAGAAGYAVGRDVAKPGGIGRAIDRYNNGGAGIDVNLVQQFLLDMLAKAKHDRTYSTAAEGLWAVAGIATAARERSLTSEEWTKATQAFSVPGRDKSLRALSAVGL